MRNATGFQRVLVLAGLSLALFHLVTLHRMAPDADEGSWVYYAVHEGRPFYQSIVTPPQRPTAALYDWAIYPGFNRVNQFMAQHFGVGLTSARFPSWLFTLMAFAILFWLTRRWKLPLIVSAGIVLFGLDFIVFLVTHRVRAEPFVFLALVSNFAWVLTGGGRWTGFWVGLMATVSLGFHMCSTFILASMPILAFGWDGWKCWRQPRYYWWIAGAMIGGIWFLTSIDGERVAQFLESLGRAGNLRRPSLMYFHANPVRMIWDALQLLAVRWIGWNLTYPLLMGSCIAALGWLIRRWSSLEKGERYLVLATGAILMAYTVFNSSTTPNYLIYTRPWLLLTLFLAMFKLRHRTLTLDRWDFGGWLLLTALLAWRAYSPALWLGLATYLATVSLGLGFIYLKTRRDISSSVALVTLWSLFISHGVAETRRILNTVETSTALPAGLTERLKTEKRALLPPQFIFYRPEMALQNSEALGILQSKNLPPLEGIVQGRPGFFLWYSNAQPYFEAFAEKSKKSSRPIAVRAGVTWSTPWGPMTEFYLEPERSRHIKR